VDGINILSTPINSKITTESCPKTPKLNPKKFTLNETFVGLKFLSYLNLD